MSNHLEPETLAIHTGIHRSQFNEHSEALYLTSSYVFDSAAQAAARFAGDEPGNIYSRFTNPTVTALEERLAALEEAETCIATSTGMSAILASVMGLLSAGDHIVASRSLFGATVNLFNNILIIKEYAIININSHEKKKFKDFSCFSYSYPLAGSEHVVRLYNRHHPANTKCPVIHNHAIYHTHPD